MSLFIACMLIYHLGLESWWYVIAALLWLVGPGDGLGRELFNRRWTR